MALKSNKQNWTYRPKKRSDDKGSSKGEDASISIAVSSFDSGDDANSSKKRGFTVIDEEISRLEITSKSFSSSVSIDDNDEFEGEEDKERQEQEDGGQILNDIHSSGARSQHQNEGIVIRQSHANQSSDSYITCREQRVESSEKQTNNLQKPRIWLPESAFTNIQPKRPSRIVYDAQDST